MFVLAGQARAASFQDFFTNRETIVNSPSGNLQGDNTTATIETGEPRILSKPGGHSLWISWVAPADGVATFSTDGSSFDTLLAAYYFGSTNDTAINQLHLAAANDDASGIAPASTIQFGAQAGQHYEITVDGYRSATGSVRLRWDFLNATSPPPIVVGLPNDQSAKLGDPVTLSVNVTNVTSNINFEWNFNGNELPVESTNLVISSLQTTDLGRYTLRISIGNIRFFTQPVELQVNSEGDTNTLARDKLLDSGDSGLIGDDGGPGPIIKPGGFVKLGGGTVGVVRGYTGSQVFNTTFATNDPGEPAHCGIPGGSSYWLMYQPPTNGLLALDTIGSTYDTVMEVYTANGTPTNYSDLISIACDNNGAGTTNGASKLSVSVVKTRQYYIVVDGVNGARGTAWLNYKLATNQPPSPPQLTAPVTRRIAQPGDTVSLAPSIAGAPPLSFTWKKNQTALPIKTSSIVLSNVTFADTADYTVTIVNDMGSLNAVLPLGVIQPPTCQLAFGTGGVMTLTWITATGFNYFVEEGPTPMGPWQRWTQAFAGNGLNAAATTSQSGAGFDSRFYRIRIE